MVYRHARAKVGIDVINYATKHTTKVKAIFSYRDHREHTILLSKKRVNKGMKRMNS